MPTYTWNGSAVGDWSVPGDWTPTGGPPGGLDIAYILAGATVSIDSPESILGLTVASGAQLDIASAVPFTLNGAIDNGTAILNAGDLVVGEATADLFGTGALGLAGANDTAAITALNPGDALFNYSQTITGTGTIGTGGLILDNLAAGVIDAATLTAATATLTVTAPITNAGLLEATTAVLDLSGTITGAGTIAAAGDTVQLDGAYISGNTLTSSGTATLRTSGAATATLDGSATPFVNLGDVEVTASHTLALLGTLDNQGTIALDNGATVLIASATLTLSGGGTISAPSPLDPPETITAASPGDVLINVNDTIAGGIIGGNPDVVDSSGTLSITNEAGGVITGPAYLNAGTYGIVNRGLISGNGVAFTTLVGLVDNTGGTLDGTDLSFATVSGGTVGGDVDGGLDELTSSTLDGSASPVTTNRLEININASLDLTGTIINNALIALDGSDAYNRGLSVPAALVVDGPTVTLAGTGEVYGGGTASYSTGGYEINIKASATNDLLVNTGNTIFGNGLIGGDGQLSLANNAGAIIGSAGVLTIDVVNLTNQGTLGTDGTGTLVIAAGTYTDLTGTWIAQNGTIELPAPSGIAGIAGSVTLDGTAAEFVSSTGTNVPALTNSYIAPETILAGATLAVLNGATFGLVTTPGTTIVIGGNTITAGNSLEPFGNAGLLQLGGGTVSLQAQASNTGRVFGFGSLLTSGATLNNAGGTVEANGGLLSFAGQLTGGSLAVDPGATLELSSTWYAGAATIPTAFIPGDGLLKLDVTDTAGTFTDAGTLAVSGFVPGDTIDIAGTLAGGGTFPGVTIDNTGTALDIIAAGQTIGALGFAAGTANLQYTQDGNNNEIITAVGTDPPCFAAGTHIRTAGGDIPVEFLRVGDQIPTVLGGPATIIWLGHRHVDCARHPHPHNIRPIRIQANALADGVPRRDLFLSPDHAIFRDGVLIPIRYLLNGASIAQIEIDAVTYWHVELDRHDIILAEGLPSETYLDTGNRAAFANAAPTITLHPDFARRVWAQRGCAELVLDGPRIAQARQHLLARTERLGHRVTDDAALRIMADGRTMTASVDRRTWRVRLPPGTTSVRLLSRSWVPAHMRPNANDHRNLGIAIANIRLDDTPVLLDDPHLSSGWHTTEPDHRWTDGDAGLALVGVRELVFDLAIIGSYWTTRKASSLKVDEMQSWSSSPPCMMSPGDRARR